jgi:hypothetical protein
MLLFTAKTRKLLDMAIQQLPDARQHQLWLGWANKNPQLRRPGGITADDQPPPPPEILTIMLTALGRLEISKRTRLNLPNISDDEISDIENDLTYIVAVSQDLRRIAKP